MESVVVDGERIAYERTGWGRPVVLPGGAGIPTVAWELCGVREDLVRAGFEMITCAARGVAPSDASASPYSMADMAGDLAGLMDALGLAGAAVVGTRWEASPTSCRPVPGPTWWPRRCSWRAPAQ
ncbi:alpha/beta fold hydrolase [Streptomyces sp. NPDC093795]|uniref:alpha/beta fold hydrolase n=1 Tax=Streptomyces sp. NPDC093795 TaxID=3366051 RepID=UPI0037F8E18B